MRSGTAIDRRRRRPERARGAAKLAAVERPPVRPLGLLNLRTDPPAALQAAAALAERRRQREQQEQER